MIKHKVLRGITVTNILGSFTLDETGKITNKLSEQTEAELALLPGYELIGDAKKAVQEKADKKAKEEVKEAVKEVLADEKPKTKTATAKGKTTKAKKADKPKETKNEKGA